MTNAISQYCSDSQLETLSFFLNTLSFERIEPTLTEQSPSGYNSLHIAAKDGQPLVIERLTQALPQETQTDFLFTLDRNQYTPLHLASLGGHVMAVHTLFMLLAEDKRVEYAAYKTNLQLTSLHFCCQNSVSSAVAQMLLHFTNNIRDKDLNGKTALHYLCQDFKSVKERVSTLSILMNRLTGEERLSLINDEDHMANTASHYACYNGLPELLEKIFDYIPPDKQAAHILKGNADGENLLHKASSISAAHVRKRPDLLEFKKRCLKFLLSKLSEEQITEFFIHNDTNVFHGGDAIFLAAFRKFELPVESCEAVTLTFPHECLYP